MTVHPALVVVSACERGREEVGAKAEQENATRLFTFLTRQEPIISHNRSHAFLNIEIFNRCYQVNCTAA